MKFEEVAEVLGGRGLLSEELEGGRPLLLLDARPQKLPVNCLDSPVDNI